MRLTLSAGIAAIALLAASPAVACGTGKVLFSDDFKQVDASWGFDSPDVQVEDGKVKVKPQPDISNLLVYKGILFNDADYCLVVRTPNKLGDNDNTMAGPIFWAKDYDNYYMFMVTPSGFAEITRKVNGKWIDVVEWKQSDDIKRPAGSNNLLEVTTNGSDINDLHQRQALRHREGPGARRRRADRHAGAVGEEPGRHLEVLRTPGHGRAGAAPPAPAETAPAPATVAPKAPTP